MGGTPRRWGKIFEDGRVLRRWGFVEAGTALRRWWGSSIFRVWKTNNPPPLTVFGAGRSKNPPPSSSFGAEERRTSPSSSFDPEDRIIFPFSIFGTKIGSRIAIGPAEARTPRPVRPTFGLFFGAEDRTWGVLRPSGPMIED